MTGGEGLTYGVRDDGSDGESAYGRVLVNVGKENRGAGQALDQERNVERQEVVEFCQMD